MACSITGVLPMGTNRVLSNICTRVNEPWALHMETVRLGALEVTGTTSATSSPTLNTCSTSRAEPLQKLSAHSSKVFRHSLKSRKTPSTSGALASMGARTNLAITGVKGQPHRAR